MWHWCGISFRRVLQSPTRPSLAQLNVDRTLSIFVSETDVLVPVWQQRPAHFCDVVRPFAGPVDDAAFGMFPPLSNRSLSKQRPDFGMSSPIVTNEGADMPISRRSRAQSAGVADTLTLDTDLARMLLEASEIEKRGRAEAEKLREQADVIERDAMAAAQALRKAAGITFKDAGVSPRAPPASGPSPNRRRRMTHTRVNRILSQDPVLSGISVSSGGQVISLGVSPLNHGLIAQNPRGGGAPSPAALAKRRHTVTSLSSTPPLILPSSPRHRPALPLSPVAMEVRLEPFAINEDAIAASILGAHNVVGSSAQTTVVRAGSGGSGDGDEVPDGFVDDDEDVSGDSDDDDESSDGQAEAAAAAYLSANGGDTDETYTSSTDEYGSVPLPLPTTFHAMPLPDEDYEDLLLLEKLEKLEALPNTPATVAKRARIIHLLERSIQKDAGARGQVVPSMPRTVRSNGGAGGPSQSLLLSAPTQRGSPAPQTSLTGDDLVDSPLSQPKDEGDDHHGQHDEEAAASTEDEAPATFQLVCDTIAGSSLLQEEGGVGAVFGLVHIDEGDENAISSDSEDDSEHSSRKADAASPPVPTHVSRRRRASNALFSEVIARAGSMEDAQAKDADWESIIL